MSTSNLGNPKKASELLFEAYLRTHGYVDWTHETSISGKPTTPDYRLEFNGASHFFEVKEFESAPPSLGFGFFDPYVQIREKINQAARQFKHYREFSCSVILANPHSVFLLLDTQAILGAMLGNLGFRVGVNVPFGTDNPVESVFLGGGKMVNDKRKEPQNTTISSVMVVGTYPLRHHLIQIKRRSRERELQRSLTVEEILELHEAEPESEGSQVVRVMVCENPFARIPLSRDLFRGPYDERFGLQEGHMQRVFRGEELQRIEDALSE